MSHILEEDIFSTHSECELIFKLHKEHLKQHKQSNKINVKNFEKTLHSEKILKHKVR